MPLVVPLWCLVGLRFLRIFLRPYFGVFGLGLQKRPFHAIVRLPLGVGRPTKTDRSMSVESKRALRMWIRPRRSSAIGGGYCHGARRIKVRMLGYGCGAQCAHAYLLLWSLISLVRLSLWSAYSLGYLRGLVAVDLPVVVRFDVARGTRGIVVWVNVVRVLCCCVRVAYMRGMPTVFGFLSFLSLSRNLLYSIRFRLWQIERVFSCNLTSVSLSCLRRLFNGLRDPTPAFYSRRRRLCTRHL
jgi:hypothetical protein